MPEYSYQAYFEAHNKWNDQKKSDPLLSMTQSQTHIPLRNNYPVCNAAESLLNKNE